MYVYEISQGNPEGTQYSFTLQHEQQYTKEQLQEIVEHAMVEILNKQCPTYGFVALSCLDPRELYAVLETKGFSNYELQA